MRSESPYDLSAGTTLFPTYQTLEQTRLPYYGDTQLVQDSYTGEKMVLKKLPLNSNSTFQSEVSILNNSIAISHPHVARVLAVKIDDNIGSFNNAFNASVMVEYLPKNLLQESTLKKASCAPYTESDLLIVAENLISALTYFERKNIHHGDIRLETVFTVPRAGYKISNPYLNTYFEDSVHDKILMAHKKASKLPQIFKQYSNNNNGLRYDNLKGDVFALGILLLSLGTLTNPEELYDLKTVTLRLAKMKERLEKIRMSYSKFTYELIRDMLLANQETRPSFITLASRIFPYQNAIRAKASLPFFSIKAAYEEIIEEESDVCSIYTSGSSFRDDDSYTLENDKKPRGRKANAKKTYRAIKTEGNDPGSDEGLKPVDSTPVKFVDFAVPSDPTAIENPYASPTNGSKSVNYDLSKRFSINTQSLLDESPSKPFSFFTKDGLNAFSPRLADKSSSSSPLKEALLSTKKSLLNSITKIIPYLRSTSSEKSTPQPKDLSLTSRDLYHSDSRALKDFYTPRTVVHLSPDSSRAYKTPINGSKHQPASVSRKALTDEKVEGSDIDTIRNIPTPLIKDKPAMTERTQHRNICTPCSRYISLASPEKNAQQYDRVPSPSLVQTYHITTSPATTLKATSSSALQSFLSDKIASSQRAEAGGSKADLALSKRLVSELKIDLSDLNTMVKGMGNYSSQTNLISPQSTTVRHQQSAVSATSRASPRYMLENGYSQIAREKIATANPIHKLNETAPTRTKKHASHTYSLVQDRSPKHNSSLISNIYQANLSHVASSSSDPTPRIKLVNKAKNNSNKHSSSLILPQQAGVDAKGSPYTTPKFSNLKEKHISSFSSITSNSSKHKYIPNAKTATSLKSVVRSVKCDLNPTSQNNMTSLSDIFSPSSANRTPSGNQNNATSLNDLLPTKSANGVLSSISTLNDINSPMSKDHFSFDNLESKNELETVKEDEEFLKAANYIDSLMTDNYNKSEMERLALEKACAIKINGSSTSNPKLLSPRSGMLLQGGTSPRNKISSIGLSSYKDKQAPGLKRSVKGK